MPPSIRLFLSEPRAWRSDFRSAEGEILYKSHSPGKRWDSSQEHIVISRRQAPHTGKLVAMAEIEYHPKSFFGDESRSKFKVGKTTLAASEILQRKNWRPFGYGERVFDGSDGWQYVWKMSRWKCELFRKDRYTTSIAVFNVPHGFLSGSLPITLEIAFEGQEMVDEIIMTFIYMERLRAELRKRRNFGAGAEGNGEDGDDGDGDGGDGGGGGG